MTITGILRFIIYYSSSFSTHWTNRKSRILNFERYQYSENFDNDEFIDENEIQNNSKVIFV